ncbi:Mariner Mos1 transposase [Eumeta japonica]|uniref:Mariner Mos1 transposase n=1 Tax=Eumeta variegata TaxID=151549 RepID=A0A4C1U313_EUMVA|nr:Mariner Mos1 transposase [Eumeta japonica]
MARGLPEAHRLLVEPYNEVALSERTCREWFQKFKNGDLDVEDKDRSGGPKNYADAELEEDSSQTQKELALTLEVSQRAVSHRLKSLGSIHKQGWVPYELKPRDVELRLYMSKMLARHKKKVFYVKSSLVMKSGYIMIIQKEENHGDYLATRQHPQQNRIFMEKAHAVCLVGSPGCGVLRIA